MIYKSLWPEDGLCGEKMMAGETGKVAGDQTCDLACHPGVLKSSIFVSEKSSNIFETEKE